MSESVSESSKGWLAPLFVTIIGIFMSLLDSSIVNVAVSTIMTVFGSEPSSVQWVSTAYLLALGVAMPLSGWLGDKFGYKMLYIVSLAVFVMGSLFCSISWSLNSLIFARVLQAFGGGMIQPTVMAMIYRLVPRKQIGSAMGIFGVAVFVAPALGPTIGGYLVEYVDWRWVFTINLPIGVVGIVLAFLVLPEFESKDPGKLDVAGALSSAVMLVCLLFGLSKGQEWGWLDERTVLLFVVSFFALVLFIYLELSAEKPLLDLRVFKYLSFTMGNLILIVSMVGLYAGTFYIPLFLQSVLGLGAMETGLIMMPAALVSALFMPMTGKLYDKIGAKPLVLFGVALLALLTFTFRDLSLATPTATICLWVSLRGAVSPFTNMPSQTAALADIPKELVGRASALLNIIARVASSFGLAILTSLLTSRRAFHQAHYAWTLSASDPATQHALATVSAAVGGGARGTIAGLAWLQSQASKLSFVSGVDDIFIVAGFFTLFGILPALFLKRGEATPSPSTQTK
jgi:EmrB/QacA subfamily drug resistance transporter